ncbi:MAG: hypothetical protein K1X79_09295 [Oligoflexia bacterium]|nr:hypothetical protein [Oligoflexia bacterium]
MSLGMDAVPGPADGREGAAASNAEKLAPTGGRLYVVDTPADTVQAIAALGERNDRTARIIKRLLDLPDLTRTPGSPVKFVLDAVLGLEQFRGFDVIEIPRVVPVAANFDRLNTAADHPARRSTDTFYVRPDLVLRTQTTAMWPFYLDLPEVQAQLRERGDVTALCHGQVWRNDELDRTHSPCFHQIDGLRIVHQRVGRVDKETLIGVLVNIAKAVYGDDVEWQVKEDSFPFTDPSIELGLKLGGKWLEVLGAGCVHPQVLRSFGYDPAEYSGWAFGFGIDRLAMIKMQIPDIRVLWSQDPRIKGQFTGLDSVFTPVSEYPATRRDITFVVPKSMSLNRFFEIVREEGIIDGEMVVEEVAETDRFEHARFGADSVSLSFKIMYRSHGRTLTNDEVNAVQVKIRAAVANELGAILR